MKTKEALKGCSYPKILMRTGIEMIAGGEQDFGFLGDFLLVLGVAGVDTAHHALVLSALFHRHQLLAPGVAWLGPP